MFGFSSATGCSTCIEDGVWTGKASGHEITLTLTFIGDECNKFAGKELVHN